MTERLTNTLINRDYNKASYDEKGCHLASVREMC